LEIFLELLGILEFFGFIVLFVLVVGRFQHQREEEQLLSPKLLQLITSASTISVALHKSNSLIVSFLYFSWIVFFWSSSLEEQKQKENFVVRRLAVGPTSQWKPARDSNPESSDINAFEVPLSVE
jgi:hypothetical protein